MNKYFQILILFVLSVSINAQEQVMWSYIYNPDDSDLWKDDRSNNLAVLKSIIENNSVDIGVSEYRVAVKYLYRHHKETEIQFLLENLTTKIDTTNSESKLDEQWRKFYIDKYHLGLLGDLSAIEGMDSVARYSTRESIKQYAIRNLSEIDIFDHYEYVKREYLKHADEYSEHLPNQYLYMFASYGRSPRYREEVKDIIFDKISTLDKNERMKVYRYASALSCFDKKAEIDFYNDCFYKADSTEARHSYFIHLRKLDKDGQPERTMYALPIEKDPYFAAWEYIQNPKYARTGFISRRYLMPFFINFMSSIQFGNNTDAEGKRISYLKAYRPFKPDSTTNIETILDTLISYTNQSYGYEWIKDDTYKSELLNIITTAKNHLELNDSLKCRSEIEAFQNIVNQVFADSAVSYPKYISDAGYKFLYYQADYILERLPEAPPGLPVKLIDSQGNLLQGGSLKYYDGGWKDAIDNGNGTFSVNTERTTVNLKMTYAGGSQQLNNIAVGSETAVFQTVNSTVQLKDSQGILLDGGIVKYYASGWKDFGTVTNREVSKELLPLEYSFRMSYAGASVDKKQNIGVDSVVVFQTVNTSVQLKDSQGILLDGGIVKYYASGWKDFGTATNGEVTKELLPLEYSFRMSYAGASIDKKQNIGVDKVVAFQTVNTTVQLQDSQGNLLDGGIVKYYASGWKDFGVAESGEVTKELLPLEYSFRMSYAGASVDKKQNIGVDSIVFQTVNTTVQLKDSQGNLLDGGIVKYYASGWKDFGVAESGEVTKELLPLEYSFRMSYAGASVDKKQNIGIDAVVAFQTVNTTVQLLDSQANLLDGGIVKYYASGWKEFGTATNGEVIKELLPILYSFRMSYAGASVDKKQNIGVDSLVAFQTVNTTAQLKDSQGNLLDGGVVKYYASGWKDFGAATNGEVTKELLPLEYSYRMSYAGASVDKKQNIGIDAVVAFQTVNTTVQLLDSQANLLDGGIVKYYASGWKDFGVAESGEVSKELLPLEYSFRMSYAGASVDKKQNIGVDSVVDFQTVNTTVQLKDSQGNLLDGGIVKYYASGWKDFGTATNGEVTKELLPVEYSFRMTDKNISNDKKQYIGDNSTVEFTTILATITATTSNGSPIENAEVQYYSQGWQTIGNTNTEGAISLEMLPKDITFRAKYNLQTVDKKQDTATNSLIEFVME
jgi:hypothetical protein